MKAEEKARNNFYIAVPLLSPDPVEKNQPITIRKSTVIKKKIPFVLVVAHDQTKKQFLKSYKLVIFE